MKIKLLSLILLLLIGCHKPDDQGYKTYTIKGGKHRSTYAYHTSKDTIFNWSVIFDSSAIYTTKDSLNQLDINKLIGWSDCGEGHMEYSIRFGWRWLNDSLEIHWFKHENGHFSFAKITTVNLCEPYDYYLKIHDWDYEMAVDGVKVFIPRNCVSHKRKYKLYPYFGGEEAAPHTMKIKIKDNS
tara:strand:- start:876 stop:1427 length:552 start_codon:yes stop_codon:yes gene_type:complete